MPAPAGSGKNVGTLIFWLPIGYHPWWYRQIRKAIACINRDVSINCLLKMAVGSWDLPNIRIAWKNMLPSTDNLLNCNNGWRMG